MTWSTGVRPFALSSMHVIDAGKFRRTRPAPPNPRACRPALRRRPSARHRRRLRVAPVPGAAKNSPLQRISPSPAAISASTGTLPQAIGHRALARGLSDLAAMGARPIAAFLSLGLPRELTTSTGRRPAWVDSFLEGLMQLAAVHKTPLAGGDLSESPIPIADIVLIGAVPRGKALLRSTAGPGHLLYVTGALGGAAAALEKLAEFQRSRIPKNLEAELRPQLYPQPRIAQGLWLVRHGVGPQPSTSATAYPPTSRTFVRSRSRSRSRRRFASHPPRRNRCSGPQRRRRLRNPFHRPRQCPHPKENRRRPYHQNRTHRATPPQPPGHYATHPTRPRTPRIPKGWQHFA